MVQVQHISFKDWNPSSLQSVQKMPRESIILCLANNLKHMHKYHFKFSLYNKMLSKI